MTLIYLLCVFVGTRTLANNTHVVRGQREGVGSLLLPRAYQGSNWSCQARCFHQLSCLTSSCLCVWEQEGASQSHRHQNLAGTSILPCCNHTFLPKAFPTHNNLDTYQLCAPYKPSREARVHLQVLSKLLVFPTCQMRHLLLCMGCLFFRGGAWPHTCTW